MPGCGLGHLTCPAGPAEDPSLPLLPCFSGLEILLVTFIRPLWISSEQITLAWQDPCDTDTLASANGSLSAHLLTPLLAEEVVVPGHHPALPEPCQAQPYPSSGFPSAC